MIKKIKYGSVHLPFRVEFLRWWSNFLANWKREVHRRRKVLVLFWHTIKTNTYFSVWWPIVKAIETKERRLPNRLFSFLINYQWQVSLLTKICTNQLKPYENRIKFTPGKSPFVINQLYFVWSNISILSYWSGARKANHVYKIWDQY